VLGELCRAFFFFRRFAARRECTRGHRLPFSSFHGKIEPLYRLHVVIMHNRRSSLFAVRAISMDNMSVGMDIIVANNDRQIGDVFLGE
jgi:hypothetical protein